MPTPVQEFIATHPDLFSAQLWEPCGNCGQEPVYMPHHLCTACLMGEYHNPKLTLDPSSGTNNEHNPTRDQAGETGPEFQTQDEWRRSR